MEVLLSHLEIPLPDGFADALALRVAAVLAVKEQEPTSQWMTAKTAALYLDMSEQGLRALVKRRQVPFERTPVGHLRFSRAALDDWVRSEAA